MVSNFSGTSGGTFQAKVIAKGFRDHLHWEVILCNIPVLNITANSPYLTDTLEGFQIVYPVRSIYETLKLLKPDYVWTNFLDDTLVNEAYRISKEFNLLARIDTNIFELMVTGDYYRLIPRLAQYISQLDKVVACSEAEKELIEFQTGKRNIRVIPSAIDPSLFTPVECVKPNIGVMGRVVPIKNQVVIFYAFKELLRHYPEAYLVILGGGSFLDMYRELASQLGIDARVRMFGFQKDIYSFFKGIRVFCLPSFSENSPQTVLEAYSAGVPCILADMKWSESFKAPLKAKADSPREWFEKMKLLLDNRNLWSKVRERQSVELQRFTVERVVEQYREAFEESLGLGFAPQEGKAPLVSVIVPVKNRRDTIRRCLDSILSENYPALEIIVVDGASTDGTLEILQTYRDRNLIKLISGPDRNQSEARNKGLEAATGKYVTFQDSDDEMIPGKIRVLSEYLENHPEAIGVFGNTTPRREDGKAAGTWPVPEVISYETLKGGNYIGSGSIMLRNLPEVRFDENAVYGEDWKLWLQLMKKYRIDHVPCNTYFWTVPSPFRSSVTSKVENPQLEAQRRVMEVEEMFRDSPYNIDFRIALFCAVFGMHPFGGPAVRGYHLSEMLARGRSFYRVFYHFPPHSAYNRRGTVLVSDSAMPPEEFNVFWVENGEPYIYSLNKAGILPIIGTNIIPNSAPDHVVQFFQGSSEWMAIREKQIEHETLLVKRVEGKFWLAQSRFQEGEYRRLGVTGKVYLAPNPVDVELFSRKEPYGDEVIWVGDPSWAKGPDILLKLAERNRQVKFHMFSGRDMAVPQLKNLQVTTGKTTFELPGFLQKGRVFLSTSYTENQPLAVLEAMACELPIVAFRTSGMPEIVEDGRTGYLAPLGDIDALEDKLVALLQDEELRIKMGKAARAYVVRNFTYWKLLDTYMEIFKRYLEEPE